MLELIAEVITDLGGADVSKHVNYAMVKVDGTSPMFQATFQEWLVICSTLTPGDVLTAY